MKALTDRQERFIHEYLVDQNASAAAARAGYASASRASQAARLMQDPQVCARIAAELEELFGRLKLNAVDVLRGQLRAAYLDPAKLFDAAREPIPLDDLDEETRGGLTVNYSLRRGGEHTTHVKQTPRHIAFAALQKRLDAFGKVRDAAFAQVVEQEEREAREAREEEEAARSPQPKPLFKLTFDLPAGAAQAPAQAPGDAVVAPPSMSDGVEAFADAILAGAKPRAATAVSGVPAVAGDAEAAQAAAPEADPDAPPSPYEPGYDYKKDPNAAYGGRFRVWTMYQEKKKAQEKQAREAAAAVAAPDTRIAPGRRVMPRMEPGYNPPWLRDNRPKFAIGAGEFYFSGEEP
ncbi:MAG: hypothetical protein JWN73_3695, partial [Betaproteobacteria bacterium]|nr:hypothetical protein [Betaproteobacteria bacterium]